MVDLGVKILKGGNEHVIVLHDWFGTHGNYRWTWPLWDLNRRTYHFLDIRGHGKSIDLEGAYTKEEIASDVAQYIEKNQLQNPSLICHSMTALAGYQLASMRELKALFLATPVPPSGSPIDDEMAQMILERIPLKEGREEMLAYQYGGRLSKGWIDYKLSRFQRDVKIEAVLGYFKMFARHIDASDLDIKCPIHVLVGARDHEPFSRNTLEGVIKSSHPISWSEHPEVGHAPMEEAPPYYVASVEAFLDSVSS